MRGLPRGWRWLFLAELPLVAGTVVYALAAPESFARSAFGIEHLDAAVRTLLLSYASVVATAVGYFYARLLLAPDVHLRTFGHYQQALLVGDAGIVALWSWALAADVVTGPAPITGLLLALFWGVVRVVFLARVRRAGARAAG